MATEPEELTRAQNVALAQLMSAVASVPSLVTVVGALQAPDRQVATEPSERATLHVDRDGHDTE